MRLLSRGQPLDAVPAYAYPEGAARALGHAVRYQAWRVRQDPRFQTRFLNKGS